MKVHIHCTLYCYTCHSLTLGSLRTKEAIFNTRFYAQWLWSNAGVDLISITEHSSKLSINPPIATKSMFYILQLTEQNPFVSSTEFNSDLKEQTLQDVVKSVLTRSKTTTSVPNNIHRSSRVFQYSNDCITI